MKRNVLLLTQHIFLLYYYFPGKSLYNRKQFSIAQALKLENNFNISPSPTHWINTSPSVTDSTSVQLIYLPSIIVIMSLHPQSSMQSIFCQ